VEAILKTLRRVGPVKAILFTVLNCALLLMFSHILIRVGMFLVCASILYRWGKNPFADIDPVPFSAAVLQIWYGLPIALQYILWTIPAGDVISGRLNQYSVVNLISLALSISLAHIMDLPVFWHLASVMIVFNIVRLAINLLIGSGLNSFIAPVTNTSIYLILSSVIFPLIELATSIVQNI
jgi:hypothetical protein